MEKRGKSYQKMYRSSLSIPTENIEEHPEEPHPPHSAPPVNVQKVFSMLKEVIPEVEKKKTQDMNRGDVPSKLSNWSMLRPNMSLDFIEDICVIPPPSLAPIPWQSQEAIILDELLSVLEGFQGKYITAHPPRDQYGACSFSVADSMDVKLRNSVERILPLAECYSTVARFIAEKRQLRWGRVNQALAAAFGELVKEYQVFIAQLETLLRKNQLTIHSMINYIQHMLRTFQMLAKIADSINESEAVGGRTLSILHQQVQSSMADQDDQKLCLLLTSKATVPFFDSLQRWLYKGIVFDPYNEFLIEDNVAVEIDSNMVTGLYSDSYWSKRYTICDLNVPQFLSTEVAEIILRTGRYLNVVRQCSETTKSSVQFTVPPVERLVYSIHGDQYLPIIEKAYQFASSKLLDLLLTEYDIISRIKSLKRYYLMEQGDFIVQLLDLCEEELLKPLVEVIPQRLQSLFELAQTQSTTKHDPYKDDIKITLLPVNNTNQILMIQQISNQRENLMPESALSKTGLEGFTFAVTSKWPLSLLFNEKIVGCYQMLFRHLLNCKHVDRRLCRVWISDKAVKRLPSVCAGGYLGAFSLRQRMLFYVQNLQYYMMEEAIEPNWIRFMAKIPSIRNIDELLHQHNLFLDECMKDCMFPSPDLVALINKILAACIEFCEFIQESEDVYNKPVENQSFTENIDRLDKKFTSLLTSLLTTITNMGQDSSADKMRNILYRYQ